jgi:hypothetical protein
MIINCLQIFKFEQRYTACEKRQTKLRKRCYFYLPLNTGLSLMFNETGRVFIFMGLRLAHFVRSAALRSAARCRSAPPQAAGLACCRRPPLQIARFAHGNCASLVFARPAAALACTRLLPALLPISYRPQVASMLHLFIALKNVHFKSEKIPWT